MIECLQCMFKNDTKIVSHQTSKQCALTPMSVDNNYTGLSSSWELSNPGWLKMSDGAIPHGCTIQSHGNSIADYQVP